MKLLDISLFFSPKTNSQKSTNDGYKKPTKKVPNNGHGFTPLAKPCPNNGPNECTYEYWNSIRQLPLHEVCVTFTPKMRQQNALILHNKFKDYTKKFMEKHKHLKPLYEFYPEFSPKGHLHYHGIIYFDNANDYWVSEYKRLVRNKFGNTEGKQIYNLTNYYKYMTKDKNKDIGLIQSFNNIS